MNGLKILKNNFKSSLALQLRPHTYYLSRKRIPLEILDENYQTIDKIAIGRLKSRQKMWKERDRRVPISWETSIKYLNSDEYKKAYRGMMVWEPYRRNLKGNFADQSRITRNRCIVDGFVVVGSPCPICRDKYLIIHPQNIKLIEQFINPATDDVYPIEKVMLCEYTYEDLVGAIEIARDNGNLKFRVPFRQFEYEDFYSKELLKDLTLEEQTDQINSIVEQARMIQNPTNHPYAKTKLPL